MSMNPIDSAAMSVLSSNEVLLAAPNNAKLTALYPTPGECTSVIAQSVNNSGQLFVNSNTLRFGSSSNFQISSANILDSPMLRVAFTIPAAQSAPTDFRYHYSIVQDGWLFGMIRSIEVSYSNSNLSNLILTSTALRGWALAQCRDAETRSSLLRNAGQARVFKTNVANTFEACLPISFLNWGSACLENGFPFDARTINGIISIQINWQPDIHHIVCAIRQDGTEADVNVYANNVGLAVVGFKYATISMRSYQLMDAAFSVGSALAVNPQMRYTIPAKWLNSYTYRRPTALDTTLVPGRKSLAVNLELSSAPAGMLQGIMIHVRPTMVDAAFTDNSGCWVPGLANTNYQSGLRLRTLRLSYSGQNIVNLTTEAELDSYMQFIYGDNMKTRVSSVWSNRSSAEGNNKVANAYLLKADGTDVDVAVKSLLKPQCGIAHLEDQIYIIPLMHDGKQVMRERHFENLPQYSGSALTLDFTVANEAYWYADRQPNTKGRADGVTLATSRDMGGDYMNINEPQLLGPGIVPAADKILLTDSYPDKHFSEVEVTVTYIIAALVQNSHGMVELQI